MWSPRQRHAHDLVRLIADQITVSDDDTLFNMLEYTHDKNIPADDKTFRSGSLWQP
ncbi:Hypothetical protein PYTT_0661 [Akkermansia glycaniphila]|uniref:Uncharacterized protein n=1 Tax=Akkermansia glycaniphila TaxID=1679444 RepID=A0A1H6KPC9_9BACT|nr:Hypothetical protein PYTT_0661 [Akkermansia glycaniphila]